MDCIRLTGIDVYAYHGALAAEKELGQRFVIDLELWTDVSSCAESDNLEDALDYTKVHSKVVELTAGTPYNLIESLAGALCVMLLQEFGLEMVSVTVHKPNPPISNFLGSVSVTVERMREELNTLLGQ
jgi:7,8-dihydroneopterin aldolase/epimerase/oxygenase